MKSNLKKIGKYLLILLLLVLALVAIAMLFLFFVQSASLFGICYISTNKTYQSNLYNINENNISYISVQNSTYPVRVINSSDKNFSVSVYCSTFGYVKKKNSKVQIDTRIVEEKNDKHLIVVIDEPHGFAYKGDSYIVVNLPKNISVDLNLINKSAGASIDVKDTTINNFSYQANSGDVYLNNGKITEEINLDLNRARLFVSKNFAIDNTNVYLNLTSGEFNTLENDSVINDLVINNLTTGSVKVNKCKNLQGKLISGGGRLNINSIEQTINFNSSDTNVNISKISGQGGNIALSKAGNVSIENVDSSLVVSTNDGNIKFAQTTAAIHLSSVNGDITVENAAINSNRYNQSLWNKNLEDEKMVNSFIWLENSKGKTNLTFNGENIDRSAYIKSVDGMVNVNNAYKLKLFTTGSANANIKFLKVIGKSYLTATKSGNISIYTPTNEYITDDNLRNKYTLTTQSNSGRVSVEISQTEYFEEPGDANREPHSIYVGTMDQTNPQGEEWTNNVIDAVTYSGALTVRNW